MNSEKKSLYLTGGTGYIGSGILRLFLKNNWNVTCAVRNLPKSKYLQDMGANIIEGNFDDNNFLINSSLNHDAIIHTAEIQGNSTFMIETTKALLEAAQQTSKTKKCVFIWCSGAFVNGDNDLIRDEFIKCDKPIPSVAYRVDLEEFILNVKSENLITAVIRPTWVYGHNNSNYMNDYLRYCKENNEVIKFENDIYNISFVHVDDVANYFYLVTLKEIGGAFNATDNNYITSKAFCEGLANYLKTKVVVKEYEKLFKFALTFNQKILTKRADEIGWKPEYTNVLDNLDKVYKELYMKDN